MLKNGLRKYSNKPFLDQVKNSRKIEKNVSEEVTGGMTQRLTQLSEDAGIIKDAIPFNLGELHSKLDKIVNNVAHISDEQQVNLNFSKIPRSAGKLTRDIAMNKPWDGYENINTSVKRMKMDQIKDNRIIIKRPEKLKNRIHNAKEGALDYQLSKISQKGREDDNQKVTAQEDDGWSEMYKERLMGPSMLLNDSFASVDNSIKSLADQRIMDAQRRGEFKNLPRGKKIDGGYGSIENMFVERTEYHLNEILKKQDALPPWIESQNSCDLKIKNFRHELDEECIKWLINQLIEIYGKSDVSLLVSKMETFRDNEISGIGERLRSEKWLRTRKPYFESKIRELNDTIRGYNLQGPLASQKFYLLIENELNNCYRRIAPKLPDRLKLFIDGETNNKKIKTINPRMYSSESIPQKETESLGIMIKKLFW